MSRNVLDHPVQKDIESLPCRGVALSKLGAGLSGEAAGSVSLTGGGQLFKACQQHVGQWRDLGQSGL